MTRFTTRQAKQPAPTPAPAAIAPAETTPKEAPTAKQTASTEVEELQQQIKQTEQYLKRIELARAEAHKTIDSSKKRALQYESELKDLLSKLQSYKASFEAEQQQISKAEQKLIACEAQMTAEEKRLSTLKARLEAIRKPEIYVCSGDIQAENCIVPDTIDTSGWAKLISSLPEEIGEELRKRDAETLLRLRAITRLIEREDVEIIFEHEVLQRAYEAMLSNE
jgi:DNA repair exonuclease SbcCD ATPase subunit